MMELFSLGADRGAYTETDVTRDGPGPDRLDAPTGPKAPACRTSASTPTATTTATRRSSARPATGRGKTPCGCASSTRLHASFFVSKLWSYFVPTPPADSDPTASLQGLYIGSGYSIRRGRRGDPDAPGLPRRARLVTPPVVYNAGLLRAIGASDRHDRLGVALRGRRAAAVLPAERLRLGLHALARHLDRQGALGNRQLRHRRRARATPVARRTANAQLQRNRGTRAGARRPPSPTGRPAAVGESDAEPGRIRPALAGRRRDAKWQKSPYRAMRQNALRMLIATSPDMQVS